MDAISARRSVRKYTSQDVTDEQVEALLRAAMAAPSAGNEQPWHFIVLRDKSTMNAVTDFHPYSKMLPSAPVAILVCGDLSLEKYEGFWVQDCSAAIENLLIKVTHMGLGAVWLGVHPDGERVKGARKLFGIPENVVPLAIIPVGYPAEEKGPVDRYDGDRIHKERW